GALITTHPRVPAVTAKPLRLLDGMGALRFGPESVGFDGEDIPWEKVRAIRLHDAFAAMTTDALDAEIDRLREVLPPLPGRKRAVTALVDAMAAVVLASLEKAGEQRLDTLQVGCEIVYLGGLRKREKSLRACLFTTALLAQQPGVAESLVATALASGVPVEAAESVHSTDVGERVRVLRERADRAARKLAAEETAQA
ncbi:hypothetical protein P8605_40275, partial [Streptomyces sp. T-3]|nr:hypothetical protein [Streptomyces sp. T-3]